MEEASLSITVCNTGDPTFFSIFVFANYIVLVMQRYEEINKVGEGSTYLLLHNHQEHTVLYFRQGTREQVCFASDSMICRRNRCPEEDPFEFSRGRNPQYCDP